VPLRELNEPSLLTSVLKRIDEINWLWEQASRSCKPVAVPVFDSATGKIVAVLPATDKAQENDCYSDNELD
jgi:hypothetical protein